MRDVETAISELSPMAAFTFALSCTERQWPVAERALREQSDQMAIVVVFRQAIDFAWAKCLQDSPIPIGVLDACRREMPVTIGNPASAVWHTIANSVLDRVDAIQRNDAVYSYHLSGRNIGLIELLLDEQGLLLDQITEDKRKYTPKIVQVISLVKDEIQHQTRDLEQLKVDGSSASIQAVKTGSLRKSLFEDVWFS
jgi:hypothetical protein